MGRIVKNVDSIHTESTSFELQLPDELNTTPKWEIQISPTKTIIGYEFEVWDNERKHTVTEWGFYIVNSKTKESKDTYYARSHNFRHLHAVKQFIIDCSVQANVKRKTRRQVEEVSDNDDD